MEAAPKKLKKGIPAVFSTGVLIQDTPGAYRANGHPLNRWTALNEKGGMYYEKDKQKTNQESLVQVKNINEPSREIGKKYEAFIIKHKRHLRKGERQVGNILLQ